MSDSLTEAYAARLKARSAPWWKQALNVQTPYRWHLRSLKPGLVLDVGCGLGRNLHHVRGQGVGIDPNPGCVQEARASGLVVYAPDEFATSPDGARGRYDTLLISHVLEHMSAAAGQQLLAAYLPYLRIGGRVVMITPQALGYRSDPTHVEFMGPAELRTLAQAAGLKVARSYSFPFPKLAGALFKYNETVVIAERVA